MTALAPLISELADRIKRLEVRSVAYFHTDHFEPWRNVGDVPAVGQETVDSIHDFLRVSERIDFARRLTLFYKPHLNYAFRRDPGLTRAHPDDLVAFLPRTEAEERFGRAAMHSVAAESRHEIQLHIHHEYYTATRSVTDPAATAWFATPLGRALDHDRLAVAIKLNREIIERETGYLPDEWFFVHGQWGLNASDDESCTITDEIDLLMQSGCRGDFTFPAGRPAVNPRIKVPYLCNPLHAPKSYDLAEAAPEIAWGNGVAARDKFFLWSCDATSMQSSLDYMSGSSRRHLDDTKVAAEALIDGSYRENGCLFIKTHAHSMHADYFEHTRAPVFPHQHPAVQQVLGAIFDAATQAGAAVRFLTASEVYQLITNATAKPDIDLVDSYLRSEFRWPRKARREKQGADLASAPPTAEMVEQVCGAVTRVLRERTEKSTGEGSSVHAPNKASLADDYAIPASEVAAADIVARHVPKLKACHEIGSGLGTLSCLLALSGRSVVGIERDRRRHGTAVAIWRELSQASGIDRRRCQFVLGSFPETLSDVDCSRAIAIVTDFVTMQTPTQLETIVEGLKRYRYVLLDLQRFCREREDQTLQEELLHELQSCGFKLDPAFDLEAGQGYTFALFRNKAVISEPARSYSPPRLMPSLKKWAAGVVRGAVKEN